MKPKINDLFNAIQSRQMAGVNISTFEIHPQDYFYLEAEWLRDGTEHPFQVSKTMGVTLYINKDMLRLGE